MKRYLLFATYDSAEWFEAENNVGMVDTPEEAVAIIQQENYESYQLFELTNDKLQPASARCPVTNTVPNPQDPDNSKRRLLIEYLEMNDGTAYEVKQTPQVLIKPELPEGFPEHTKGVSGIGLWNRWVNEDYSETSTTIIIGPKED